MPRVFIAIPTPVDLQRQIDGVRGAFQSDSLPLRWVKPSALHITLSFLGETPQERLLDVSHAMTQASTSLPPFTLNIRSLGCFPRPTQPRVLWIGVDDPSQNLTRLHQQLITHLENAGFQSDTQRFHPHITLARIRKPAPKSSQFSSILSSYHQHSFGQISVEAIHLFESRLQPSGPIYSILDSAQLQALARPTRQSQ